ncbi:MAG: transglycosylase SLT domain-containing protein, partial [Thiobacillaceae bacterium]
RAAGIWQFIPSTGRVFGLQQNAWYDGRRDVLAATRAALDYLEALNRQFGSWELALAAYNCGEGCVARAIARNRARGLSTSYAALPLPTETRHYVPKLLAVRNLVRDPQTAGLSLQSIANEPYFVQVKISQPMQIGQAAKLADISMDEFLALNPAFQRRVIHTDTRGVLLLPADKVEVFHHNLQNKATQRDGLQVYQGRKGESVNGIAGRFGVTLAWLKEHNPLKLFRGKLVKDQVLYVPMPAGSSPARLVQFESGKDSAQGSAKRRDET